MLQQRTLAASVVIGMVWLAPARGQSPARSEASTATPAFEMLKSLAGDWRGEGPDGPVRVSWRVTSGGAAILQEMVPEGRRPDPTNGEDDPITMIYVDDNRLLLTMYCDTFKNRPRMLGTLSADGRTVTFDFLDVAGGGSGYMNAAVVTMVDRDHHTEEWGVLAPDGHQMRARMNLVRVK